MDYEKKYNEALAIAKETYETQPVYRALLEKMFPELRESEDERIRKRLIDCLKFSLKGAEEQDAAGCSRQKDIEAYKWGIAYLEKQKEQKPESCDCSRDEESYTNGIHHVLMNPEAYGLIKQKPVEWSEEDDWKRKELIQYLEEKGDYRTVWMTWLKSLRPVSKESLQPHWKHRNTKEIEP